ncbi:unnamed protein product [Arctia plantaginis]|uniref:DUF7869 domain-containing protein n=1 Tax=Arctia plantaginis TaxID=874455 RepID=A0A8S1B130_ARCPL|nr:unnamed protein product [Arctia plantaginis]
MIRLPLQSTSIVPLDNIENYSLVQNTQIEVIDLHDMTTCDVSNEDANTICYSIIPENNDEGVAVLASQLQEKNNDDCNIENWDIISNFSNELDCPKLVAYSSTSDDDSVTSLPTKSRSRKRRSQVNKSNWFAEKNKKLREHGAQYYGKIKKDSKWVYETVKEPKRMKNRCKCNNKTGNIKCATVTDEQRIIIFNNFWKDYTWGEKKVFVNDTVQAIPTKRPRDRKQSDKSRRTQSFKYNLKTPHDDYIRVCKTMYLNTLAIGRMTIIAWKDKMKYNCTPNELRATKDRADPFADRQKSMNEFFDSLPTMESHYCRASSSRQYLQPDWKTKMDLYKFYVSEWCKSHATEPLSRTSFFEVLESRNISLFRPKKDECETCTRYKSGTTEENDFQLHILKKEEARKEKQADKEQNQFVFTVDLQAVLMAPQSNVSTLYYKTKLQVHNLCFYDNITKDGYCFVWNESEGGLSADEFAFIWTYFIEKKILSKVENKTDLRVIIYSDGCGYQNRNVTLSNALLNLAVKNQITIEQKYLEVGHTQMEVDAMHSSIERRMRNRIVNVPADYIEIIKTARNSPFYVKYLEHGFFKAFNNITSNKSIRPGRTAGDPKVTDIRALMYSPSGNISYKLRFSNPWTLLPQRKGILSAIGFDEMQNLHQGRLKIKAKKYNDLQQIKEVLPADFREFYNNLPHD